jgi:hypothetical protein
MLGILWCKPQCGPACPVVVCSGKVRYGGFRQGRAIVADGSKEGLGSPCCSLDRADMAGLGSTRRGVAGRGVAIAADGSTELRKRLPAALFGE